MVPNSIKALAKKLKMPLLNTIVLESNPEMSCNTMPVYIELIKRHVNDRYKIIWMVEDKNKYLNFAEHNVSFTNYEPDNVLDKIRDYWYKCMSKALIFSNRMLEKKWKNQLTINLTHGMPLKSAGEYKEHDTVDYVMSSCEKLNTILAKEYDVSEDKFVTLGYPRTDVLGHKNNSRKQLSINLFDKIIVWMPTFRKHKANNITDGRMLDFGLPLLDTIEQINHLNDVLAKWNIVLIIKLHPAQDVNVIKEFKKSNIIFLSDEKIKSYGTTVYELLAESDALLTDYSSVYYDYLLVDKPIGLIIDDISEYEERRGFAIESYKDSIKGTYIEECNGLEQFVDNLAKGYDPDEKMRKWAMNEYCDFTDFKSTERVVDFIMKRLK